jgi:Glycosyl transferase family 2
VNPRVSVVIPTFQRRRYVCRAVESVLSQTFGDFELIVVDDGSTDGTAEALRRYRDRIRYRWQPNRGLAAARNTGISLGRGAVLAFLDSDDRWLPDHLEVVTEALERHPEAVLASTCPRSYVGGRQTARDARLVDGFPLSLVDHIAGLHCCLAVRREHLLAVGGYNEEIPVAEDVELCLRLAARGPFSFVQRRTVVRQYTKGSLEQVAGERGYYLDALRTIAEIGIAEVKRLQRPDREELARRAEGKARYVTALHAIARSDDDAARAALADACELLPELSREAAIVARRIELLHPSRAERARHFAAAATLWPDLTSETALYLRSRAIVAALLAGKALPAVRLAAGWPWRAPPAHMARAIPLWARLGRRNIQRLIYRGSDF